MTLDPSCTPGLHCQQQGRVVVRQRVTSHLHCHSTNKLVTYLQHTTIQNTMPPIPSSNCYTMPFSMCLHISMFLYLSWFAYIDDKRSSSTESSSCKNNFYGIVLSFGGRVIKNGIWPVNVLYLSPKVLFRNQWRKKIKRQLTNWSSNDNDW